MTGFSARRHVASTSTTRLLQTEATVLTRDGRTVNLGQISSPYEDRARNWLWKKHKSWQIRRLLAPSGRK